MNLTDSAGGKNTIYPTNTCFTDALEYLEEELKVKPLVVKATHFLVHGILTHEDGYQYSHAWVEVGEEVTFSGIWGGRKVYCTALREEYYREMGFVCCTRYSFQQVLHMNLKHENYGPWEEKYLKLCRNYQEILKGKKAHSYEKQ